MFGHSKPMKFPRNTSKGIAIAMIIALGLTFKSNAQASAEPTERGRYYVCPNGKSLLKDAWDDYHPMSRRALWYKVSKIDGEIIIGKTPENYPEGVARKMAHRILEGINVPTSYKLIRTKLDFDVWTGKTPKHHRLMPHTYEFANSTGKKLSLTMYKGATAQIKQNSSKILKTHFYGNGGLSRKRCTNDAIIIRVVNRIILQNITNQFGEKAPLPMMFLIREFSLNTYFPASQNEYDF